MEPGAGGRGPTTREQQEATARAVVLRQLSVMARSREQLRLTLGARGIPDEVAAAVLDRFEEVGLVDDSAYADMLVRTQREQRGLSRRALEKEMRRRGVDESAATPALAAITAEDEFATALEQARKKARATRGLERPVRERRIAAMLGRRGYSVDVVLRATRTALSDD
ncbi:MAG: regulatory protein RecX [Actinomycetales bacterium]|nr:regulatory protein RecX [Actinomycetales bacterium]